MINKVLACLIALRFVNVFLVRTWFVPDEYWQSLEVAHEFVFGYGYLTWEWKVGIRSYLYPLVFATFYYVIEVLGLSGFAEVLILGPRFIEALFTAVAEWCYYEFLRRAFSPHIARWALFCLVSSWCWWYCATRTLTNTFETGAVCVALRFFNWEKPAWGDKFRMFVVVTVVATAVRPTSLTVWAPLYVCLFHCCFQRHGFPRFLSMVGKVLLSSGCVLFVMLVVDRYCYNDWRNVHLNFVRFNLLQNRGTFYGSHPWHWYFTQGLPIVLGTHTLFVLGGVGGLMRKRHHPLLPLFTCVVLLTLLLYSVPGHKEFRFILPLLPFFMIFAAIHLASLSPTAKRIAVAFLLTTNITAALYTGLVHQSAPLLVMRHLRENISPRDSVLFLLPCHSTPYHSHLHRNISMRFLTCEPPTLDASPPGRGSPYHDEADLFYAKPEDWIRENMELNDRCHDDLPTFIVLFDVLFGRLSHIFHCYVKHFEAFHTHFPEGRVSSHVLVLRRR